MVKRNPSSSPQDDSTRQIDPEVAAAARRSGQPDGLVYDTTALDGTGPSNWFTLAAVLVVVGGLVWVLIAFI
jgi:hypothetical protein